MSIMISLRKIKQLVLVLLRREILLRQQLKLETEFHGSFYGGWAVQKGSISPESVVVSIGIGEDASFDISLMDSYQCNIYAYDPTPKSVAWVRQNVTNPRFKFHRVALSDSDGELELFLPQDDNHVSASFKQGKHLSQNCVLVPCASLQTILKQIGFDRINVLKMDIEGSEYQVIRAMCQTGIINNVDQLLIEFHHHFSGFSTADTRHAVKLLNNVGFKIAWVSPSGHEVLFCQQ